MADPARGEIWLADVNPIRGHEQGGTRPTLIVSANPFNYGLAGLVIILPLTSRAKGLASHVQVMPPEGGLSSASYIKCEDIRSVSKERLIQRWGAVSGPTLVAVEQRLRLLLGL